MNIAPTAATAPTLANALRTFAVLCLVGVISGCAHTSTSDGALLGGVLGAGLGAIIGHQSGHQGEGALIGAGAGALTGAIIGDAVGKQRTQLTETVTRPAALARPARSDRVQHGYYITRIVTAPSGETYEERVWVREN